MVTAVRTLDSASERADLEMLRGPQRTGLVAAALTSAGEFDPQRDHRLKVSVDKIHHRPGAGVSVAYNITFDSARGTVKDYVVASTSPAATSGEGVAVLNDGDRQVRMWRRPFDPVLTGLRQACSPSVVRGWLADAGIDTGPNLRLEFITYRPTRRAVLRATDCTTTVFIKVMPAARSTDVVSRHELLAAAGVQVPQVLSVPAPGVCVLAAVAGAPMANAIAAAGTDPDGVPDPGTLVAWLDSLPRQALSMPRRQTWTDRLDFHSAAAAAALPQQREEINELADVLQRELDGFEAEQTVPTHGDFYEANIFTSGGQVCGVIDLDSVGPGRRSDDLATMLGHLSVLPDLSPRVYCDVPDVIERYQRDFENRVPPRVLRVRTAAVALSLVANSIPTQARARLAVARRWARSAFEDSAASYPRAVSPTAFGDARAVSSTVVGPSASEPTAAGEAKMGVLSSSAPEPLIYEADTETHRTPTRSEGQDHGTT